MALRCRRIRVYVSVGALLFLGCAAHPLRFAQIVASDNGKLALCYVRASGELVLTVRFCGRGGVGAIAELLSSRDRVCSALRLISVLTPAPDLRHRAVAELQPHTTNTAHCRSA